MYVVCKLLFHRFNDFRFFLLFVYSFGLTENYIVFIEQPYVVSLNKILSSVLTKGQSFKDWVEWNPEYKNRFYVIDKSSGKVVSNAEFMSDEAFFFVHMSKLEPNL